MTTLSPTLSDIQTWLVTYLNKTLGIIASEIDLATPFNYYGLDSATAIIMMGDLETWLGHKLDPTLVYDYPTIDKLSTHLVDQLAQRSS